MIPQEILFLLYFDAGLFLIDLAYVISLTIKWIRNQHWGASI